MERFQPGALVNVRNRDLQSVVDDIQQIVEEKLTLPTGYYVTYGGQFENLQSASKRLKIAVPIALLLIFVLLYFAFKSVKDALLIYSASILYNKIHDFWIFEPVTKPQNQLCLSLETPGHLNKIKKNQTFLKHGINLKIWEIQNLENVRKDGRRQMMKIRSIKS